VQGQIAGGSTASRGSAGARASFALCFVVLAVVAALVQFGFGLDESYSAAVVGVFAAGAWPMLAAAARHLRRRPFGAANQVTLLRGAMIALVFGLLVAEPTPDLAWFAIVVASAALVLDGVDGSLARRRGTASDFGARFDMETDALAILVLAALVWHFDKAGPWVVLSGLLRYGFVAAAWPLPWMRRPLPPSRRRKTVCVVQIGSLLFCLAPVVPSVLSGPAAAVALAVLGASFATDVEWLARRRRAAIEA
jgi:phosphatidylglycerophosphate synthase